MEPYTLYKQKDFASHPLLQRLLTLHDIPKEIYIEGELPSFSCDEFGFATPRILTVVGSRKGTEYGKRVIEHLISSLKGEDVVILSGFAYGTDTLAHKAALKHGIKTFVVPGSGLDIKVLYPRTNYNLREDILKRNGVFLSEYTPLTSPLPWTFPKRNRIMAALSDAVLVIEAGEKSGTLVTARQALELGKNIGAVPGDIFSETTYGTHDLIKNGASPITTKEDLFDLLRLPYKGEVKVIRTLTVHEETIYTLLREPQQKEQLFTLSKLSFGDFMVAFSSLEIDGYIFDSLGEVRRLV